MAESGRVILAGDIGGTNARLALFRADGDGLVPVAEAKYRSQSYSSLQQVISEFVRTQNFSVSMAGFGVAGPVREGLCQATNLPWLVDCQQLARCLGLDSVVLINDLEANAYGISTLSSDDFAVLQAGSPDAQGNAAVISPGTGLGEAGLYWDGTRHQPFATEGGHSSFAPNDDLQDELLRYLRSEFGHVSWERVLSGPGLLNIYKFLRHSGRGSEPEWLADQLRKDASPTLISRAALSGQSELCSMALDLFVTLLAVEAGHLALKLMATGGVYLGGGIAPQIIEKLKSPNFCESFVGSSRMQRLLESIPVRVILNDKAALRGAARCASLRMRQVKTT